MKKSSFFIALTMTISSFAVISCGKDKPVTSETADVQTTKDGNLYVVDTLNSKVEWKGYKVVKSDNTSHFGGIKFESGEVTVKDDKLESGKFVVNMNTLASEDIKDDPESAQKLDGHLKNADFFDTEKFPTASFEITKVSEAPAGNDYNTILDGNLTIKGITKPATFKANVKIANGELQVASEQTDIDRTLYGVEFQVPAANGLIKNDITLQIKVKAFEKK